MKRLIFCFMIFGGAFVCCINLTGLVPTSLATGNYDFAWWKVVLSLIMVIAGTLSICSEGREKTTTRTNDGRKLTKEEVVRIRELEKIIDFELRILSVDKTMSSIGQGNEKVASESNQTVIDAQKEIERIKREGL